MDSYNLVIYKHDYRRVLELVSSTENGMIMPSWPNYHNSMCTILVTDIEDEDLLMLKLAIPSLGMEQL